MPPSDLSLSLCSIRETMKKPEGSNEFMLPKCCQQPRSVRTKPRTDFTNSAWTSPGVASWSTSSSSKSEDDDHDRGKGKRKCKPKVHFDESIPVKSPKNLRKLKIMRHLGLIAPPGSPFAKASGARAVCLMQRFLRSQF